MVFSDIGNELEVFYVRPMYNKNSANVSKAVEKIKNNTLTVEEVLDEEDFVNDLKSPSFSQLSAFLTIEKIEKLLDYILIEPAADGNHKVGHKFPYFACEILCSENSSLLEKFFEDASEVVEEEVHTEEVTNDHLNENTEATNKTNIKEKYFEETKDSGERDEHTEVGEDSENTKQEEHSTIIQYNLNR